MRTMTVAIPQKMRGVEVACTAVSPMPASPAKAARTAKVFDMKVSMMEAMRSIMLTTIIDIIRVAEVAMWKCGLEKLEFADS